MYYSLLPPEVLSIMGLYFCEVRFVHQASTKFRFSAREKSNIFQDVPGLFNSGALQIFRHSVGIADKTHKLRSGGLDTSESECEFF